MSPTYRTESCQHCGYRIPDRRIPYVTARYCSQACKDAGRKTRTVPPKDPAVVLAARSVVTASGCREWSGLRDHHGYGLVSVNGMTWFAHRLAWTLAHGPIPAGVYICHHCDNPPCREESHLFAGSAADNAADMRSKGRECHGEDVRTARLTEDQVREIRAAYTGKYGETKALVQKYGVNRKTLYRAIKGVSWDHVE